MSDILAELDDMEQEVQNLLSGVENAIDPATSEYEQAVVQAVLNVLDEYELQDLSEADLFTIIDDALATLTPQLQRDVQSRVAEQLQGMVDATQSFYAARGLEPSGVAESVRRSNEAQQLGRVINEGMNRIDDDLKEDTVDVLIDAVSTGTLDAESIGERISKRAGVAAGAAQTQARTSLNAYNQLYRNELAQQAQLSHFLYYGSLMTNSRSFCRLHAGSIYDEDQIAEMDNGMLNPVRVFKGGYNCRHSWVPVDPAWDEELQSKVVDRTDPDTIPLNQSGTRSIKGFAPATVAGQRRVRQAELGAEGYVEFIDAESNDEGFVALHRGWRTRYNDFPDGTDVRKYMKDELRVGQALKETGSEALYTRTEDNRKGGDVDVIWDGRNTEIKTPEKFHAGALNRPLKANQSDNFIVALEQPLGDDEPEAYNRLHTWMLNNPEKEVWVLHYYRDELEKVEL